MEIDNDQVRQDSQSSTDVQRGGTSAIPPPVLRPLLRKMSLPPLPTTTKGPPTLAPISPIPSTSYWNAELEPGPPTLMPMKSRHMPHLTLPPPPLKPYCPSKTKYTFTMPMDKWKTIPRRSQNCDVTFIVGIPPVEIKCHKRFLMSVSQEFEKMVSSQRDKEEDDDIDENVEIVCLDVAAKAFQQVVNYIYNHKTDQLSFNDLPGLAMAAKRFGLENLQADCMRILMAKPLFTIYNNVYDDPKWGEFAKDLWGFICRTGRWSLKSKDFVNLSRENLDNLLKSDNLNCEEVDVYRCVMIWARSHLTAANLEINGNNLREILGIARKLIRFPLFTPDDFVRTFGRDFVNYSFDGILTRTEISQIYFYKLTQLTGFLKNPLSNVVRNIDESWFKIME